MRDGEDAMIRSALLWASVSALSDPYNIPCPAALWPDMCLESAPLDQNGGADFRSAVEYAHHLLQVCIEIEHSTIPLYLTAAYSMLDEGSWAHGVVRGIAIEEMLHLTDVANVQNAIGGAPLIDSPTFVPEFPARIPLINITSNIAPFSPQQTKTFEMIEREAHGHQSIFSTYTFLVRLLNHLCDRFGESAVFSGDPARQVAVMSHGGERSRVVRRLADAVAALEGVADQGSGCPTEGRTGLNVSAGPLGGGLAHFARFTEILEGREYAPHDTVATGPTGRLRPTEWARVRNFAPNPKVDDFAQGSRAHTLSLAFAQAYTRLLAALHHVFNGAPSAFSATVHQMSALGVMATELMRTSDPRNSSLGIGPAWQYIKP